MTTTAQINSTLRGFRAPELRELARRAVQDGWDMYTRPGGHVDVVNPANGAVVRLSSTGYAGPSQLKPKRHEFEVAGLDLRSKAERRRAARLTRLRVVRATPPLPALTAEPGFGGRSIEVPDMTQQHLPVAEERRPHARLAETHPKYRDGSTVFVSDEIAVIAGERIRIRGQAGGGLIGWTPPEANMADRKTWSVGTRDLAKRPRTPEQQRAELEAKVRQWVADGKPAPVQISRTRKEPDMPGTNGAAPVEPDDALAAATARASDRTGVIWTTARVDPAEYPIASALADLHRSIGPALAALEAAGKTDAASLVRAELANTPAEAELLRLWQELTERPRLEHGTTED